MKKIMVLAAAAVAMAIGAGCSTLGKQAFADPIVTLRDVRVASMGLNGGNLDVVLNVYNPNAYRLDATRLNYQLQVDSTPLANGVMDSRFTVQDKDSTQVRIPVAFSWSGVGAGVRSVLSSGAVNYRIMGDVTVATAVGNFTVPFSQTGRYNAIGR
jgi:LEA14-like dessication related protein